MSANQWESAILSTLDDAARSFTFPVLDNPYFLHGSVSLWVFRSETEWLIVFDQVAFDTGQCAFDHLVFGFGSKLAKLGLQPSHDILQTIQETPAQPFCSDEGEFELDPNNFKVMINGKYRELSPATAEYEAAGVDHTSNMPAAARILRYLVYACPSELEATADQLLQACSRQEAGLHLFLKSNEWYHPNIAGDELPSQTETFSTLARAIALDDASVFSPGNANTRWSNWVVNPI